MISKLCYKGRKLSMHLILDLLISTCFAYPLVSIVTIVLTLIICPGTRTGSPATSTRTVSSPASSLAAWSFHTIAFKSVVAAQACFCRCSDARRQRYCGIWCGDRLFSCHCWSIGWRALACLGKFSGTISSCPHVVLGTNLCYNWIYGDCKQWHLGWADLLTLYSWWYPIIVCWTSLVRNGPSLVLLLIDLLYPFMSAPHYRSFSQTANLSAANFKQNFCPCDDFSHHI